jgi:hypothetical protein
MPSESDIFYKKGDVVDAPFPYQTDATEEKYGTLKDEKVDEVIETLVKLLRQPPESPPVPRAWERPRKPY